jgi:hypothetical protein
MRVVTTVSCIAVVLAVACGGNKGAYEPQSKAAAVDDAVAMLVEVGEVVASAGGDCDLMARNVGSWIDDNGERRKQINAYMAEQQSPETQQAYQERLGQHLEVVHGMMAGLDHCKDHDELVRTWNRLD